MWNEIKKVPLDIEGGDTGNEHRVNHEFSILPKTGGIENANQNYGTEYDQRKIGRSRESENYGGFQQARHYSSTLGDRSHRRPAGGRNIQANTSLECRRVWE
jgi:hypothetical protein